jgi:predicted small metal-binding protein
MRVIECDVCGQALTAADDPELAQRLGDHMRAEHEADPDPDDLSDLIEGEAYDAMDS